MKNDNLFTEAGSPKYVNTSAILRQQPAGSAKAVGSGGLGAKAVSPRNLGPDFNDSVGSAPAVNPRLQPVTSLHQVLYNNVSPATSNLSSPQSASFNPQQGPQQQPQHRRNQQHRRSVMLPPPQSDLDQSIASAGSSSQQHPSYPQTPNTSSERIVLEKNLEKLITEKGMEVLGQLTAEMTPQQIERLLQKTKEKLATNPSPLMAAAAASSAADNSNKHGLQRGPSGRNRRPLDPHLENYLNNGQQQPPMYNNNNNGGVPWQQQQQLTSPVAADASALSHLKFVPAPGGATAASGGHGTATHFPGHQARRHDESSDDEDTMDNR